MEIWIPVIVAIVTSLFSFFGAIYKGKSELNKLKALHKVELDKIREKHQKDLEKLSAEVDNQARLYEKTKQTDIIGDVFNGLINNPKGNEFILKMISEEMKKNMK